MNNKKNELKIIVKDLKTNKEKYKNIYNEDIKQEKEEVLSDIDKNDIITGKWFNKLLKKVIENHAKNVNFEYFSNKYQTTVRDIIAKKLIKSYQDYNTAIGFSLGASGGIFGLPGSLISMFPEICLVTYNQLKLIYDISLIYEKKINLDDPEEAFKIFLLAFGIKVNEIFKQGAKIAINKSGKLLIEKLGKNAILNELQTLIFCAIGKQISETALKKLIAGTIPIVGLITGGLICAVFDYISTQIIGDKIFYYFRTGKIIIEYFLLNDHIEDIEDKRFFLIKFFFGWKLYRDKIKVIQTLIKGCLVMANSDSTIDDNKLELLNFIYSTKSIKDEFIDNIKNKVKISVDEFLKEYNKINLFNKKINSKVKDTIFYAMKLIAVSDNNISQNEISILSKMSSFANDNALIEDLNKLKNEIFNM